MRRSTYLATTSTSRFTGSFGPLVPSVVTASVCGITAMLKPSSVSDGHGEADAVDRDRALLDDVPQHLARRGDHDVHRAVAHRVLADDRADRVDVALHDVTAEAIGQAHRALEVDRVTVAQRAEATCGRGSR